MPESTTTTPLWTFAASAFCLLSIGYMAYLAFRFKRRSAIIGAISIVTFIALLAGIGMLHPVWGG